MKSLVLSRILYSLENQRLRLANSHISCLATYLYHLDFGHNSSVNFSS